MLAWLLMKKKYVVLSIFSILILLLISFSSIDALVVRKLASILIKTERAHQFFIMSSNNIEVWFFGLQSIQKEGFYTESTLLDMILNFGIVVTLFLIIISCDCSFVNFMAIIESLSVAFILVTSLFQLSR